MSRKSLLLWIVILLTVIGSAFSAGNPEKEEEGIRDYVCRINVNHHPNMDGLLRSLATSLWEDEDDSDIKNIAESLNASRMGGYGSGFVYVDKNGVNYIITNYHSDVAWYRVDVPRAGNLKAETAGNLDTKMTLYDNEGKKIIEDDDSGRNYNALINVKVVPGIYFFEVTQVADNYAKTGEYVFSVILE